MTKPNIVLIMSDEHDPAVMGCYGDRLNPTPHLDALAARGANQHRGIYDSIAFR